MGRRCEQSNTRAGIVRSECTLAPSRTGSLPCPFRQSINFGGVLCLSRAPWHMICRGAGAGTFQTCTWHTRASCVCWLGFRKYRMVLSYRFNKQKTTR